jgi:hypothetical protein
MTKTLTKKTGERVEIPSEDPSMFLSKQSLKLYRILLALMRRHNKTTVWIHDAETAQLIGGKQSELKAVAIELRAANLITTLQSRWGCEFTLLPSILKAEAA